MQFQQTNWQRFRNFSLIAWRFVKTWQFAYLALFFLAKLITVVVHDPSKGVMVLTLIILFFAYAVKLGILILTHKMSLRQFLKMQLAFISPYVLMFMQIILSSYAVKSLNSMSTLSQVQSVNLVESGTIMILISIISPMICSLIMNTKTSKFERFWILIIILMDAGSYLKSQITLITGLNGADEQLDFYRTTALVQFVAGKLTAEKYLSVYALIAEIGAGIQNAKEFILAAIAAQISLLTIMIDLIFKPLEKLQQQSQIHEELLKSGLEHKNKQIQLTEETTKPHNLESL